MEDDFLFVMMGTELLWISVGQLLELGKDMVVPSESSPPPPFFNANVPKVDWRQQMYHHFVFNSELYVAIGGMVRDCDILKYLDTTTSSSKEIRARPFDSYVARENYCQIYRFDVESRAFAESDLIRLPPTPFAPCFVGSIPSGDDVCMLVCHGSDLVNGNGLWFLSSSGEWESLAATPDVDDEVFMSCKSFVFQDKLFLQIYADETIMYSFDPRTKEWTALDEDTVECFNRYIYEWADSVCFPGVTMPPLLSDCSVVLSWSTSEAPNDYVQVMIEALLVSNQNGAVILRQRLHDCLKGIFPTSFDYSRSRFSFVDLGGGMVCALLYGIMPHVEVPVLCISVFTLTVMDTNVDINTATEAAPPEYKSFLSVSVRAKHAFSMKDYNFSWVLDPFLFTPKKELPQ